MICNLLESINNTSSEQTKLEDVFKKYRKEISTKQVELNSDEVKNFILNIDDSKISDFGNKLIILKDICAIEECNAKKYDSIAYANSAARMYQLVKALVDLYDSFIVEHVKSKEGDVKSAKTLGSGEKGDIARVIDNISSLKEKVNKTNDSIDGKITSLLVNNISILGIFVAIAFTGFSAVSIFPDIDIKYALGNSDNFLKVIFFILLTTLLIYNLLLLLVYFVFKLTVVFSKDTEDKPLFSSSIELTAFYWIDGFLLFLVIALFVACFVV